MEAGSSTSSGADLPTKYQKVAAEYAKARQQLKVLKSAVTDERQNSNELSEKLRLSDLEIRKMSQEMESMDFRNTQLTKRVELLQLQLDDHIGATTPSKKKLSRAPTANGTADNHPVADMELLTSDLQSKLREIERLHERVFELENKPDERVIALERRLRAAEADRSSALEESGRSVSKLESALQALNAERADLWTIAEMGR